MELLLKMAKQQTKSKWRTGNTIVLYTRVSDSSQFDGTSLDTQKKDGEYFSSVRRLFIKEYFGAMVESAKTDVRKELKRMLNYVKKDLSISAILVYSYDRFSRSEHSAQFIMDLAKIGVKILSVTQEIDVTTSSGRLHQKMLFAFGNYDNELRREKSVRGMVENLQNGYWLGVVPFGYTNLRKKERAKYHDYVINKDGEILRQGFKWKAEGKMNNLEIVERMIKLGSAINYKSFIRILSNPFYCGYISSSLIPGQMVKGHHPPLVSQELFLRANDIISDNPHKGISKKAKNLEIPLKSFLKTESSEIPFTGYLKKGHFYYKTRGNSEPVNVRADVLNGMFMQELSKFAIEGEHLERIKEEVCKLVFAKFQEQLNEMIVKKRKITELGDKMEQLERRYVENEISRDLFDKYYAQYKKEQEVIQHEIGSADFESSNLENAVKKGIEIARNPLLLWTSSDYDDKQRLQYLMFPEGIRYNKLKKEVRTPRINSIFSLIADIARVHDVNKKGHLVKSDPNSHLVVSPRIELGSRV